jgi:hypothetical protein
MPNVLYYFRLNSFSIQFYATRDIKAGEQLFYSYCLAASTVAERRTQIAPYGFVCECPACVNATPETDNLRKTFGSQIALFKKMAGGDSNIINETAVEDAVKLDKDMVKEGLDADPQYLTLLMAICMANEKLGKLEEAEKYGVLVESFRKCFKQDE